MESTPTLAGNTTDVDYESLFLEKHQGQLEILKVPQHLWPILAKKLQQEVFDAGSAFCLVPSEESEPNQTLHPALAHIQRTLSKLQLKVCSEDGLKAESDIFLVDHAWTFPDIAGARKQLSENPALLERMENMMGLCEAESAEGVVAEDEEGEDGGDRQEAVGEGDSVEKSAQEYLSSLDDSVRSIDLDGKNITSLGGLNIETFPLIESLSLSDNPISGEELEKTCEILSRMQSLKGVWLMGTPLFEDEELRSTYTLTLLDKLTGVEIIDRKFTKNYTSWAIQTITETEDLNTLNELDLSDRDIHILKADIFDALANLKDLNVKGNPLNSEALAVLKALPQLESLQIDYANELTRSTILKHLPNLKVLNNIERRFGTSSSTDQEAQIDRVLFHTWIYSQTYRITGTDFYEMTPTWYLMDEVGSGIAHSSTPNCILVPFFDSIRNSAYSIFWPTADISHMELCTRDFLYGQDDRKDFLSFSWGLHEDAPTYLEKCKAKLGARRSKADAALYKTSAALNRSLPPIDPNRTFKFLERPIKLKEPIFVFTNSSFVRDFVRVPEFQIVGPEESHKAKIIWLNNSIDFSEVPSDILVNQFPFEACLISKQHLAYVNQVHYGNPEFLPMAFNLQTEYDEFVAEYTERQETKQRNIWIVKPWSLARSMDTTVSDDLLEIARQTQSGNRVACKYIEQPALWKGRKFDMRFIVLLKRIEPLEAYIYNEFWLRLANSQFSLDTFDEYEKHFTVMNYGRSLEKLLYTDFVPGFEAQHPHLKWKDVRAKINLAIRDAIEAATNQSAADHIPIYPNGRAMYGVDCMITEDMTPQILEFTFMPDCTRACTYNPQFMNYIFTTLYLDDGYDPDIFTSLF